MRTIYEAKNYIKRNIGKKVLVEVLGIRNKIEYVDGIITECHDNIFLIKSTRMSRSYSYTDVLVGNVRVHIK